MTRLALIVFVAAVITHQWHIATVAGAIAAVPLAARIGYRAAVRRSGVGMVRAGARRVRTGRFA